MESLLIDGAWTPVLTMPNHPEYPAAHSCTAASLGESLRQYYGTDKVTYTFDSKMVGTSRTYTTTDQLTEESRAALSVCAGRDGSGPDHHH